MGVEENMSYLFFFFLIIYKRKVKNLFFRLEIQGCMVRSSLVEICISFPWLKGKFLSSSPGRIREIKVFFFFCLELNFYSKVWWSLFFVIIKPHPLVEFYNFLPRYVRGGVGNYIITTYDSTPTYILQFVHNMYKKSFVLLFVRS